MHQGGFLLTCYCTDLASGERSDPEMCQGGGLLCCYCSVIAAGERTGC